MSDGSNLGEWDDVDAGIYYYFACIYYILTGISSDTLQAVSTDGSPVGLLEAAQTSRTGT
jgi:hypothetical protein